MTSEKLSKTMRDVLGKILNPSVKVVSFDLFDTLLVRPVTNPHDIWRLVGKIVDVPYFREKRLVAERKTRQNLDFPAEDCNLDMIYDTYCSLFDSSESEAVQIKEAEIQVEMDMLYARESMKYLYHEAKRAGKQIIIISDMYLSSDFVTDVLSKNGFDECSIIYMSSEKRLTKHSGNLFKLIASDFKEKGILPGEIIHVGDNERADYINALRAGFQAVYVKSTLVAFNDCRRLKAYHSFGHSDLDNSFLLGVVCNAFFDDPYIDFDNKSAFNGDLRLFSYTVAPFFIAFTLWLMREADKDNRSKMAFVYRDGYLPQKIYELLSQWLPKANIIPLHLSRAVRRGHYARVKNGLHDSLFNAFYDGGMSVGDFINKKLLVRCDSEFDEVLDIFRRKGYATASYQIGKREQLASFLHELEPYFEKNMITGAEACDEYVRQSIQAHDVLGIFDVGYRGSVGRFLHDNYNIKSTSYSMFTEPMADHNCHRYRELGFKSFISYGQEIVNAHTTKRGGNMIHILIEDILCEPLPAVEKLVFDGNNELQIIREVNPYSNPAMIKVQEHIFCFTKIVNALYGKYLPYMDFDKHGLFSILNAFLTKPRITDADLIKSFVFSESEFVQRNSIDYYKLWHDKYYNKKAHVAEGFLSLLKERIRVNGYKLALKLKIEKPVRSMYRLLVQKKTDDIDIVTQVSNAVRMLKTELCSRNHIVFIGDLHYSAIRIVNAIAKGMPQYNWVYLSPSHVARQSKISFMVYPAPSAFTRALVPTSRANLTGQALKHVNSVTELKVAALRLRKSFPAMGEGWPELLAHEMERYYTEVFSHLAPKLVVIWNNFVAHSSVADYVAKKHKIPTVYMETGALHGTVFLDADGRSGESWVARNPAKFYNLPVSPSEMTLAKSVISYMRESGMNRYIQYQSSDIDKALKKLDFSKKTIFFTGDCDTEGGIYPFTKVSKRYHSPMFESSADALMVLSKLALKNNWNLIYKPHPIFVTWGLVDKVPSNVLLLKEGDVNAVIDIADVVVGITTWLTYTAMIRNKPAVVLGYTLIKDKGCAYEAYEVSAIEPAILEALEQGFTSEQQNAFVMHVAQLNKYHQFDNLTDREIRYGQGPENAISQLCSIINNTQRDNREDETL